MARILHNHLGISQFDLKNIQLMGLEVIEGVKLQVEEVEKQVSIT